jgi:hypothetical protein
MRMDEIFTSILVMASGVSDDISEAHSQARKEERCLSL